VNSLEEAKNIESDASSEAYVPKTPEEIQTFVDLILGPLYKRS